jgi:hypothetical protein
MHVFSQFTQTLARRRPRSPQTTLVLTESHLSVHITPLPEADFWHTSVGVLYSNHTLGVKDAIRFTGINRYDQREKE